MQAAVGMAVLVGCSQVEGATGALSKGLPGAERGSGPQTPSRRPARCTDSMALGPVGHSGRRKRVVLESVA